MTDNEIIKALECCTTKGASCKNCPTFVKVDRSNCKKAFLGALDIINRQKHDIECLKATKEELLLVGEEHHIEEQRLRAEIERLQSHIQEGIDLAKQIPEMLAITKAEAIKEFAERLKSKARKGIGYMGYAFDSVGVLDINFLVKEMVGEDNG